MCVFTACHGPDWYECDIIKWIGNETVQLIEITTTSEAEIAQEQSSKHSATKAETTAKYVTM